MIEGRHVGLVDEMTEERGLGQELDVGELGPGLKGNLDERGPTMEPAGRVNVGDRHREEELPRKPSQPAHQASHQGQSSAPEDMVAMVDRLQERVEMAVGPRRRRRRDQDESMLGLDAERVGVRKTEPLVGQDDLGVGLSASGPEQLDQTRRDRVGPRRRVDRDDTDMDALLRAWLASEVGLVGVDKFHRRRSLTKCVLICQN